MISHAQLQKQVIQLYISVLGRAPERGGLDYWTKELASGATLEQVAQLMINISGNAGFFPPTLTAREIITSFYSYVLQRSPDQEGLNYWTKQLESQSVGKVIVDLILSVENYSGNDEAALKSKSLFLNKQNLGQEFALTLNGENIEDARRLISKVNAGSDGLDEAKQDLNKLFKLGPIFPSHDVQFEIKENSELSGSVNANNYAPKQAITYLLSRAPTHGHVKVNADGTFLYQSENGYRGADSFVIAVRNQGGYNDTQVVSIQLTATNQAPSITSKDQYEIRENLFHIGYITAVDSDSPRSHLTFTINGGKDADQFSINQTNGAISFKRAPDFENPTDSERKNIYELIIAISDGEKTSSKKIQISVLNENDTPAIITTSETYFFAENTDTDSTVFVPKLIKLDASSSSYHFELSGADASLFSIDTDIGAIKFKQSPDFEHPLDEGRDNDYVIRLRANDSINFSESKTFHIKVTNIIEPLVLKDDYFNFSYRDTYQLDVLKNDSLSSSTMATRITSVTQPLKGGRIALSPDGQKLQFIITSFDSVDAMFSYTVSSSDGVSATAQVILHAPYDPFTSISQDDLILGGSQIETIEGGLGKDTIDGGGGLDRIEGGGHNDTITAHGTELAILGGLDKDILILRPEFTSLTGLNLQSPLNQGYTNAQFNGSFDQARQINFSRETNTIIGGFEDVDATSLDQALTIQDSEATSFIRTGRGNDTILATSSLLELTIISGEGDDIIITSDTPKSASINAGDGNDTITGGSSTTFIDTGNGNDKITSYAKNAVIFAGEGNKQISALESSTNIHSGSGIDTIIVSTGANTVFSNDGNDIITAGSGNDYLNAGSGDDIFYFSSKLTSEDTVIGGEGIDTIFVSGSQLNDSQFSKLSSIEHISFQTSDRATITLGALAQRSGLEQVQLSGTNQSTAMIDSRNFNSRLGLSVTSSTDLGYIDLKGSPNADKFDFGAHSIKKIVVDGGKGGDQIKLGSNTQAELHIKLDTDIKNSILLSDADLVSGFNVLCDKINLDGITLSSPNGSHIAFSSSTENLRSQTTLPFVNDNPENLKDFMSLTNQSVVIFQTKVDELQVPLDSQAGILQAADFITSHLGVMTAANTTTVIIINDGTNTVLFLYNEGALDQGIQIEELSLIGVLYGTPSLSIDNFV